MQFDLGVQLHGSIIAQAFYLKQYEIAVLLPVHEGSALLTPADSNNVRIYDVLVYLTEFRTNVIRADC